MQSQRGKKMKTNNPLDIPANRLKSGTTPGEQSNKLLILGTQTNARFFSFLSNLYQRPDIATTDKAVIELLFLYGLRISEVLNIKATDVTPWGAIVIHTSKTKMTRVVVSPNFGQYWYHILRQSLPLSQIYSRFYYYRLFRKLGYYAQYGNNENFSVTHYFRHEIVRNMEKEGIPREVISHFLAHRAKTSIESYVTQRK